MKTQIQKETANLFWTIFGVICFALAYRRFLIPIGLYSGGFTGIAQLIKLFLTEIAGWKVSERVDLTGIIFWCINIPLFGLGYKSIGKKFLYRTLIAVSIQSILLAMIPAPASPLVDDILLNCIIGGALSGFGVGVTLRAGGSGGGLDIVGMYCTKNYPDFSVGKLSILINLLIYGIAAYCYDLSVAAYSMVFCIVSGIVVDRVHYQNIKVSAFIVTNDQKLGEKINQEIGRGVTSWSGWGEYSHKGEVIHMVVINKFELQTLKKLVYKEDPNAFIQIISPDIVFGNFEKRLEVM